MKHLSIYRVIPMALALGGFITTQLKADDSVGWFVSGDVGPSFVQSFKTTTTTPFFFFGNTTTKAVFNPGIRADADVGYNFNRCWALEAELGYIYNPGDTSASTGDPFRQMPLFVNGLYTIPLKFPVKPHLGLGVGVVTSWWNGLEDVNAAGQAIAGLKYGLTRHIDLALDYKFIVTTPHDWNDVLGTVHSDSTLTHSILASLTYKF